VEGREILTHQAAAAVHQPLEPTHQVLVLVQVALELLIQ
jgi:hypothetical protein